MVKAALEHGIKPRCHFEDITRADFYGFVVPFATELMRLSEESGIPIKIRACDTLGLSLIHISRSAGADDALRLIPPREMTLEQALDYIAEDELAEITPSSIRLRKRILDPTLRMRANRNK